LGDNDSRRASDSNQKDKNPERDPDDESSLQPPSPPASGGKDVPIPPLHFESDRATFLFDWDQANKELERHKRLAEIEDYYQYFALDAEDAEDRRGWYFRKSQEERQRIFMEGQKRRADAEGPVPPFHFESNRTTFLFDWDQANKELERHKRLAEIENYYQYFALDAEDAEDRREWYFRRSQEERQRIFMEGQERRADAEGRGAPPRPPTVPGDVANGTLIPSGSIEDDIQAERDRFTREREEMARERARLKAERDAARDALIAEKQARVRALEEELARLQGELENARTSRSTDGAEARERECRAMAESNETWALLGDVTNSIQDQREVYEQTKVLTEGRWNEKRVRRQQTELKWIGLWDIMRKIDDDRNRAREARLADESKPGKSSFCFGALPSTLTSFIRRRKNHQGTPGKEY
jgi:hypothetical protein